jgi:hypothetical protein
MLMDAGLDTGPGLLWRETAIDPRETAGELHDRLAAIGASAIVEAVELWTDGRVQPRRQPADGVTYAAKLRKDEARIDWSQAAIEIDARVRAFNPWPVAETRLGDEQVRIWRAQPVEAASGSDAPPGTVIDAPSGRLHVSTGDGTLEIWCCSSPAASRCPRAKSSSRATCAMRVSTWRRDERRRSRRDTRERGAHRRRRAPRASLARRPAGGEQRRGSARGLKRSLCYGTLRWHYRLAAILAALVTRPPDKLDPLLRALLEVGLYQLVSGETAAHAAVSETVSAARALGFDRAAGFVNACCGVSSANTRPCCTPSIATWRCARRTHGGSSRRCDATTATTRAAGCKRATRTRRCGCA